MTIRGKMPLLYRYSKDGRKVLIWASRERCRAAVKPPDPGPTPEQKRRFRLAQQAAAVQNLQAFHRPLKPPARKVAE